VRQAGWAISISSRAARDEIPKFILVLAICRADGTLIANSISVAGPRNEEVQE